MSSLQHSKSAVDFFRRFFLRTTMMTRTKTVKFRTGHSLLHSCQIGCNNRMVSLNKPHYSLRNFGTTISSSSHLVAGRFYSQRKVATVADNNNRQTLYTDRVRVEQVYPRRYLHHNNNRPSQTTETRSATYRNAIARNKHIIRLGKQKKWKEILAIHQIEKDHYTHVNYATTMNLLGKIMATTRRTKFGASRQKQNNSITNDPLFVEFINDLIQQLQHRGIKWMGVREISNCIHALGKLQFSDHDDDSFRTKKLLLDWMDHPSNIHYFVTRGNAQDMSNVIWACGIMGITMPNLFGRVEQHAEEFVKMSLASNTTQAIANTLWSYAKLGYSSPNLFNQVEQYAEPLVSKSKPQHIANMCWAFAKSATSAAASNCSNVVAATDIVDDGHDTATKSHRTQKQDIKQSVTLPEHLFAAVDNRAEWFIRESGDTQHISNTLWAFAALGSSLTNTNNELFFTTEQKNRHQYAKKVIEKAKNPQEVANILWSFATLNIKAPNLFRYGEERMEWCIQRGSTQAVSNIIWSFGVVFQYYSPRLFSLVNEHSARLVEQGNAQFISNVALAFATVGVETSSCMKFFDAINHPKNMNTLLIGTENEQSILNTCYSLVILDLSQNYKTMLSILWKKVLKDFSTTNLSRTRALLTQKQVIQLVQVQMYAKASGVDLPNPTCPILHAKMKTVQSDKKQSKHQMEISNMLESELGFYHEQEVPPTNGDYQFTGILDIDMACHERRIAIEYDGRYHFLNDYANSDDGENGATRIPNGATKAKRRFLQQYGWNVICLEYQEWNNAKRDNSEVEWLRQKLRNVIS